MLRALLASFCLSLTVLLAACGSDGGSPASSAPSSSGQPSSAVSSNVVKGLIRNGVVKLSRWQNGAYVTLTTAMTDGAGGFQFAVPSPVPGEVLRLDLVLSTDPAKPTQMLCDAVACGTASFGQWATLTSTPGLASWVSIGSDSKATVMPMTPLSTLLVSYAERVGGGHMDSASLGLARQRVAAVFRLSVDDLLARPGNVADGLWLNSASPAAVKLSLLAAAFAQLADNSHALDAVISDYNDAFVDNNGHLLQDGGAHSLGDIYRALQQVLGAAGNPEVQSAVSEWLTKAVAALESGKLSTACHEGASCPEFSSDRFLTALGTGPDTLGGDLRRVMSEQEAASLEQLFARELSKFGWLATSDTVAVAGVAVQSVMYGLVGSLGQAPQASNGLTPTLNMTDPFHPALHIAGTQGGLQVNLDLSLTQLLFAMSGSKVFTFGAVGTLQNDNILANINGTLTINAANTDFTPVLSIFLSGSDDPNAIPKALATILKNGKATFTLDGAAGITNKHNESRLAIEGKGSLSVDMKGGANNAIAASGLVDHGSVTLPNGMSFSVDPAKNEFLTFALAQDGTLDTKFSANDVLGYDATVTGSGKLEQLGALLTNLRDGAATQLNAGTLNLSSIVNQLLTDISSIRLTLGGQANIPGLSHVYKLSYADGHLRLSQPNSDTNAVELTFSLSGVLAQAGGQWWMAAPDLADLDHPAIVLSDDTGAEWRWEFDFSELFAAR